MTSRPDVTPNPFVQDGPVSFSQLATAHYAAAKSETPETRAHAKDAYPNLRAAFEARRGAIHSEYFCEEIVAAVVITTDGRVFDVNNPTEATGLQRLYSNLIGRTQEVARLLSGEERMRCNKEYYNIITNLLGYWDGQAGAGQPLFEREPPERVEEFLRTNMQDADAEFAGSLQRSSKMQYFLGMVVVGMLVWAPLAALAFSVSTTWLQAAGLSFVPICILTGGVGAIVSVMARMTTGALSIDHAAERRMLWLLGGFRVIIGAVLGSALCVLAQGGLVPIELPDDAGRVQAFYAGLAFLAGFGERWAQDMLGQAQRRLSGD